MAQSTKIAPPRQEQARQGQRTNGRGLAVLASTMRLALWQLRQTWRLLLVVGLGIVASVVLVCVVPLYSQVTMTAGMRNILTASPQNADTVVSSNSTQISQSVIDKATRSLNKEFQQQLGPYLLPGSFSITSPVFSLLKGAMNCAPTCLRATPDVMALSGAAMQEAPPHARIVEGRLPRAMNCISICALEIALTPESADLLHVKVGSVVYTSLELLNQDDQFFQPGPNPRRTLELQVVGIFKPATNDPFWHGNDFSFSPINDFSTFYRALASNDTLLTALNQISNDAASQSLTFSNPATLYWYYRLNTPNIAIDQLDGIIKGVNAVKVDNSNNPTLEQYPLIGKAQTYLTADALEEYQSRIAVAQFPVVSILLLVLGLVLFFVSAMANLLVDRQTGAIAIMRSRGASRQQLFGSLVLQSLGVGVVALIVGPLLAIPIAGYVAQRTLPATDQGALNVLAGNPLVTAWGLRWYVLAAVTVTIVGMILAIRSTMRLDVLALRREASRSTRIPLVLRLNADIIAAVLALGGYGFSLYLSNAGILDARMHLLLLSPLTLLESIFLLLASILLFLRVFPRILELGARLAIRGKSASALLALAQMSRTPRQSVRMTLLLALATALAIFTLIFAASQTQRIYDVAAYQSGGADFSGNIPNNIFFNTTQIPDKTAEYNHIPGVLSTSLGYATLVTGGSQDQSIPINFIAADADTFVQSANWTAQDSSQPLGTLIAQLRAQRSSAASHKTIPAIVDAETWNALHLSPGAPFKLNFSALSFQQQLFTFMAIAEVQHIPSPVGNSTASVLVDYQSFASVYSPNIAGKGYYAPLNYAWLHTREDATSLASVRNALLNGHLYLNPLYDRRAIISGLSNDPLYLTLVGILAIGAITALLLALVGNLVASWLSASTRLTNFAVLRALGSTRRQLAGVLTWEQSIVYTTALGMGLIFGVVLSVLALSALIFTSVPNSGVNSQAFYAVQSVPPVQMVIPFSLEIALAVLVVVCVVAIGMMVRIVSRPSMSQVLRLNED